MSIGSGIAMIVFGLIFLLGVIDLDLAGINEQALGVILVLGGIAIIAFDRGLFGTSTRARGATVVERRVVEERPVQTRRVVEEPRAVQQPPVAPAPPVTPQPRVVERRVVEREVDDPNVL